MRFENSTVVVAIEFGATFSRYANSFVSDFEIDPLRCMVFHGWEDGLNFGNVQEKTSSVVLLKPNKTFSAFGFDAEYKYLELTEDNEHEGWFYFKRSEMTLHQTKSLRRTTMIKDVNGKEMPAMTIFTMAIRYIKDRVMETFERSVAGVKNSDILWVLTVPAIWDEGPKQFMTEVAEEVGIPTKQLLLVSEPEAAIFHCNHIPREPMSNGRGRTKSTLFEPGTQYIVLDSGGTADITVLKVKSNRTLRQLHYATGGDWGRTKVDDAFYQFLVRLFGNDVLTTLKDENMNDYIRLLHNFEIKTRAIKPDLEDKVTMTLPNRLLEIFEEQSGETLAEALSQTRYAKTVKSIECKLRVHPDIFKDFFSQSKQGIIRLIKDVMKSFQGAPELRILLVSDFVALPMIMEAIRESFPDKEVIASKEAVISGAVIYGHIQRTQHTGVSSGIGM